MGLGNRDGDLEMNESDILPFLGTIEQSDAGLRVGKLGIGVGE